MNRHTFQLSLDVLNVGNLINSDWGVRKVAELCGDVAAPLVTDATASRSSTPTAARCFNFTGPAETFIDDPSVFSRWRAQLGLRYFFE